MSQSLDLQKNFNTETSNSTKTWQKVDTIQQLCFGASGNKLKYKNASLMERKWSIENSVYLAIQQCHLSQQFPYFNTFLSCKVQKHMC